MILLSNNKNSIVDFYILGGSTFFINLNAHKIFVNFWTNISNNNFSYNNEMQWWLPVFLKRNQPLPNIKTRRKYKIHIWSITVVGAFI